MPMEMVYDFTVTPPAEKVSIAIVERDREGVVLTATQTQKRAALTDARSCCACSSLILC